MAVLCGLAPIDEDLLDDRVAVEITEQFNGKFATFQENFSRVEQVMRDLEAASKVACVNPPDTRGKKRAAQSQPNDESVSTDQQSNDHVQSSNNSDSHSTYS